MAAINVTPMWSKEGGSGESEKYDSFATKFSHTEGYMVEAQPGDSAEDVLATSGLSVMDIPDYGARHRSGADSFVDSKDAQPLGPIFWVVTVNYKGSRFDSNVDIEWTDSTSSEPIDRDYNGRAIVTDNNEQVEGLTYELSDPVVVVRRKFLLFNAYTISLYRHATNSDTFLGWPPGTARLIGISAKNQFKWNMPLEQWDVTARVQFRIPYMGATAENAWYKRWRHEGLFVREPSAQDLIDETDPSTWPIARARDNMGQEVTKPVLLTSGGLQERNPDAAIFKYTKLYGSLPYSALGLI
tara:strand:+ start:147 stop:1043 length:897 start_codon:yes stop_codon:yes gene_type:complete